MLRTIVLDTSPLSVVTKRRGIEEADAFRAWITSYRKAGHRIIAPATARYEVARELERIHNTAGLARLDALLCGSRLLSATDGRCISPCGDTLGTGAQCRYADCGRARTRLRRADCGSGAGTAVAGIWPRRRFHERRASVPICYGGAMDRYQAVRYRFQYLIARDKYHDAAKQALI